MQISDKVNTKLIKTFKKIYILNDNFEHFFNDIKYLKFKNHTLIVFQPDVRLTAEEINKLKKNKINYWIFDWNFFHKKYYLRWIPHCKAYKNIKNKKFNFIQIIFEFFYYKKSLNNFFKKGYLYEQKNKFQNQTIFNLIKKINRNTFIYKTKNDFITIKNIRRNIIIIFKILIYNFIYITKSKKFFFVKPSNKRVAVRYYTSGLGVDDDDKKIDWIVDNKKIFNKDILIVSEENVKSNKNIRIFKKKYTYVNLNPLSINNLSINFKYTFVLIFLSFLNIALIPLFVIMPYKSKKIYYLLFSNFIKWSIFNLNYNIENFITYHDYRDVHILRNLIIKKQNCKTIHYKHTNSENVFDKKNYLKYNNILFGYNFYDIENHWTKASILMSKKDKTSSSRLLISGPIFFSKKIQNKSLKKNIISFFSTSFNKNGTVNTRLSHYKFLYFIKKVLKEFKSCKIYLKPKYNISVEYKKDSKLNEIYNELKKFKNFNIFKEKNSLNLISKSEVVVSMPFASTSIEALALKKKTIYVDLLNNFPNNYFSNIPNFCFTNEIKAIKEIKFLINISNNQYKLKINKIKKKIFGNININSDNQIRNQILNEK